MADQAGSPTEPIPAPPQTGLSFRRATRKRASGGGALRDGVRNLFAPAFTMFATAIFAGAATFGETNVDPLKTAGSEHNPLQTACYLLILVLVIPLLVHRRAALAPVIANSKLLWVFVAIATASILWSVDPLNSVRRLILFSAPILMSLYVVDRFDYASAIRIKGWIYLAMIIASAAVAILWPKMGVMHADPTLPVDMVEGSQLEGDWMGIVDHKNTLGFITLACAQIYAWRFAVEREHRWFLGAAVLLGVFITYKTHSATSSLLVAMTLVTYLLSRVALAVPRAGALIMFVVILFTLSALLLSLLLPEQMASLVGKDATLTGRVPIWAVLVQHSIPLRPLLGYGFNSFFIPTNPEYVRLMQIVDWEAPHAHNGYLNLAAELGIPATIIGTIIMVRVITGSLRVLSREDSDWPLYLLVFGLTFAVLNLVEAELLRLGDQWTFALVFAYLALAKHSLESRSAAEAADKPTDRTQALPEPRSRRPSFLQPGDAPKREG